MAGSFSSAWLSGDPAALALLPSSLGSSEERRTAVARAARRTITPALAAALRATDEALPASASRKAAIDALAHGGAAAVVTGQQVGLFLGPLYTFYKAASTVRLARALEDETGVRCVPVFWLQTEDHDFAEINHSYVPGPRKIELADDGARSSVGHRRLGASVEEALAALAEGLQGLPHAAEILAIVREAYRPERTWAAAFAHLLARCFSDEGLVIVDPRAPAAAALTTPILRRAIREHAAIERVLAERTAAIEAAGFSVQVPLRAGSPLCFYHLDDETGPRHRLVEDAGAFAVLGADRRVSADELERAPPLRLSSSALLRPVVQDTLLPTVAYVGGPGELAYFAQLPPLYRHFELPPPAFALRARFRCLDGTTRSLLERTGLRADELEAPRDEILSRVVRSELPPPEALRAQLLGPMHRGLAELEALAPSLDENLLRPLARTRETIDQAIGRLLDRYARARLEKDRVAAERVDRLQAALYPAGEPQERLLGFASFAATCGLSAWKRLVLDAVVPFDPAVRELIL